MRTLIFFRKFDLLGQAALIVSSVLGLVLQAATWAGVSWFALGGWQLLSAGATAIWGRQQPTLRSRRRYAAMLLVLAGWGLLCLFIPRLTIWLLLALLASPLLALWYLYLSGTELAHWQRRQFIQLH
ncbi:MAG: hypothetical protein MUF62_04520 [Chitinophagaceae bacterium]|jgi:Na+/proline symporter|nr:hypothetical protein [Chitinophagaceae bacterium]